MLIFGAIIARECGLPCVTGVPDATVLIQSGVPITVDGYQGIVAIGSGRIWQVLFKQGARPWKT
jgi:pyruvate,water dikinase